MRMLRLSSLLLLLVLLDLVGPVISADKYSREDFPPPPAFVFGAGSYAYQVSLSSCLHSCMLNFYFQYGKLSKWGFSFFLVQLTKVFIAWNQVEGAANEDGRTPSVWDTFAHQGQFLSSSFFLCIYLSYSAIFHVCLAYGLSWCLKTAYHVSLIVGDFGFLFLVIILINLVTGINHDNSVLSLLTLPVSISIF